MADLVVTLDLLREVAASSDMCPRTGRRARGVLPLRGTGLWLPASPLRMLMQFYLLLALLGSGAACVVFVVIAVVRHDRHSALAAFAISLITLRAWGDREHVWIRAEVLPDGYVALTGLHERYVALLEKRWHDRVGS